MQDSLPAGGLRLYREGVEPSGSLRKVSGYISILLSRTCPVARVVYAISGVYSRAMIADLRNYVADAPNRPKNPTDYPLFALFYQVEIRHRQLPSMTISHPLTGADARENMMRLW